MGYRSRQLTQYADNDGQELEHAAVDGGLGQGPGVCARRKRAGRGASGAQSRVVCQGRAAADLGGERAGRRAATARRARGPTVSPDGKLVAYVLKGQIWLAGRLDDVKAKPEQLLETRGSAQGICAGLLTARGWHL